MEPDDKRQHLDFIQGVITRHNSNSFLLKGWTITITAALYALAGAVKEPNIMFIAMMPIVFFWGLDAYYLANERCFVDLYNAVAKGSFIVPKTTILKAKFDKDVMEHEIGSITPYSMPFKKFKIWMDNRWFTVFKSTTIFWFYAPLAIITVVMIGLFTKLDAKEAPLDVNIKSSDVELKIEQEPPTIINSIYPVPPPQDTSKNQKRN